MNLFRNPSLHWQLMDGMELHSGDPVEVMVGDRWISGRVEFRPRREYIILLEDGEEVGITSELKVRVPKQSVQTRVK